MKLHLPLINVGHATKFTCIDINVCLSILVDAVAFTVALNTSSYSSGQIPFNSVIYDNRGSYTSINHTLTALESGLYVIGLTGEQTNAEYNDLGIQINGNTALNVSC